MSRARLALAAAVVLIAMSCGSTVPPPNPTPTSQLDGATARPAGDTPLPTSSSGPVPSSAPGAVNVPADIAADLDAVASAATTEAAVAATRTILEKSGVVITDDAAQVPPTAARIYVSQLELDLLAAEAASPAQLARLSFADFATAFGGVAAITPNEALLDRFAEIDFSVPSGPSPSPQPPAAGPDDPIEIDLAGAERTVTEAIPLWIAFAQEHHDAEDPDLRALTNAPLYLLGLAARQWQPLDISQPFSGGAFKLGMLHLTVLVAGLRATLAHAGAGESAATQSPRVALAAAAPRFPPTRAAAAAFSDCDQLKKLLDAHVPLSMSLGLEGKEIVKSGVKGFIEGLFGKGTSLAKAVGPAFTALGLLFRVAALALLYEHTKVDLTLEPAFTHKPVSNPSLLSARLTAGISDAEWERAKQERENDFWSTALRTCARLIGVPVPSDLIDVGEATKGWAVQWEITRGLGKHVRLREGELSGPHVVASRLERPLQKIDDHSGGDILAIDVMPEKETDHPGLELTEPVTVCAHVVPRQPPGGFKTMLSAGFAGSSLASSAVGGLFSLAGIIGDLLTSLWRELDTIDACQNANVSFHVPQPGAWRGLISVNWVYRYVESRASSGGVYVHKIYADTTEDFYVGGDEFPGFPGSVGLTGRAFTHGAATNFEYQFDLRQSSFCDYLREYTHDGGGGWSFDTEARGSVTMFADGRYTIQVNGAFASGEHIWLPATQETTSTIVAGEAETCEGRSDAGDLPFPAPNEGLARGAMVEGQIDPQNPGNRLAGSQTVVWDDYSYSVITWDLTRDGTIQLPR